MVTIRREAEDIVARVQMSLFYLCSAEKGAATKEVGGTVNLMSSMCLMSKAVEIATFPTEGLSSS